MKCHCFYRFVYDFNDDDSMIQNTFGRIWFPWREDWLIIDKQEHSISWKGDHISFEDKKNYVFEEKYYLVYFKHHLFWITSTNLVGIMYLIIKLRSHRSWNFYFPSTGKTNHSNKTINTKHIPYNSFISH